MSVNTTSGDVVVSTLEEQFKKAPALPSNAVSIMVSVTPWIALVFGILGLFASLAGLGLGAMLGPILAMTGSPMQAGGTVIYFVFALVSSVLMLAAVPGLLSRKMSGWKLLFWSEVVSIVASLLSFSVSGLLMTVVFAAIAFYLLFQIKSHYK